MVRLFDIGLRTVKYKYEKIKDGYNDSVSKAFVS